MIRSQGSDEDISAKVPRYANEGLDEKGIRTLLKNERHRTDAKDAMDPMDTYPRIIHG